MQNSHRYSQPQRDFARCGCFGFLQRWGNAAAAWQRHERAIKHPEIFHPHAQLAYWPTVTSECCLPPGQRSARCPSGGARTGWDLTIMSSWWVSTATAGAGACVGATIAAIAKSFSCVSLARRTTEGERCHDRETALSRQLHPSCPLLCRSTSNFRWGPLWSI